MTARRRTTAVLVPLAASFLLLVAAAAWAAEIDVKGSDGGKVETTIDIPGYPGQSDGRSGGQDAAPASGTGAPVFCRVVKSEPYDVRVCSDGTQSVVLPPQPGIPTTTVTVTSPRTLAEQARSTLVLPRPDVGLSPDPEVAGFQLVNLPTWWWTRNWSTTSRRTQAGPIWAVVTATPIRSVFDGGDGTSSTCSGPGRAWFPGAPETLPGACQFVYRAAGTGLGASVTTVWAIAWRGYGGQGGTLPNLTTRTELPMTVYERQVLVTDGRG